MPTELFDVVIVGAGPAGCSTALHLLQHDPTWRDRMVVLEREYFPREKLCAGGVTAYGEAALAGLSLSIDVPTVEVRELRIRFRDVLVGITHNPVFRVTRRAEFDAWLAACARERGAQLREGQHVRSIEFGPGGAKVTTDDTVYRTRVVIGADGSKGVVAQLAGLRRPKHTARLLEVVTPEDATASAEFAEQFATFDFTPLESELQGYYWDFPSLIRRKPFMNRGVFDSRVRPRRRRASLKEVLADRMTARARSLADVELKGHPIHWFSPRAQFSRPHVLLVGDAAGADPLLGEGIAMALVYGRIAAEATVDGFARGDLSFADYRRRILRDRLGITLSMRRVAADLFYRAWGRSLWRFFLINCPRAVRALAPNMGGYTFRRLAPDE